MTSRMQKNFDSKLISGCIGHVITPATLAITPVCQRGFCRGRQFALNVVDLDAYMRVYNACFDFDQVLENIKNIPCTPLYDFCNAFPTLLHAWLFLVLKIYGLPTHLWWAINWLYTNVTAYSSGTGSGEFLFDVNGGVKTGCPLSSLLFLLGLNPIADLFNVLSDGPKLSVTRICADDIGSALKCLHQLRLHASISVSLRKLLASTSSRQNVFLSSAVVSLPKPSFKQFVLGCRAMCRNLGIF